MEEGAPGVNLTSDPVEEWVQRHRLSRWEMTEVVQELRRIDIDVVLEVGCHRGDSLNIWRKLFDPSLMVGVNDIREMPEGREDELRTHMVWGRSQEPETHARVVELLGGRAVDYLYIDGDHTYDAVKRDWELYSPLVCEGGLVVLHDATLQGNPSVDVYKLWPQIMDGRRTKLLHDGNPSYPSTGVGIVFM